MVLFMSNTSTRIRDWILGRAGKRVLLSGNASELQGSMLRACGQIAEPDTQEEGGHSRVAALVEEAERLKATIAKQQEEISALQQRRAQPDAAAVAQNARGLVQVQLQTSKDRTPPRSDHAQPQPQQQPFQPPQQGPQQQQQQQRRKPSAPTPFTAVQPNGFARAVENREEENWTCSVCTFENVEPLTECEMCGTKRSYPSSPQRKRLKKSPPDVVEVDAVLDHPSRQNAPEVTAGPAEFLRCATAVIEPGIGARSASQVQGPEDEALIEVPVPDCLSAGPSGDPLRLTQTLHDRLCPYQREGVAWMWHLHARKHGGILADEMGLGKTVQACGMIRALRAKQATHVLVVMPVTLLDQWAQELKKWCPGCPVFIYHGSPTHRSRALRAVARARGGVLLTSYAIIKNEDEKLAMVDLSEDAESSGLSKSDWRPSKGVKRACGMAAAAWIKPWDLVICDEAHVMRTISTLLGKAVRRLKADCRILLTGTPVQNALQDLWALMDFAQPGLLGNHATFTKRFNDPIEKGSVRDASPSAVALKKHLCEQLWELVRPHLLRRTKDRVGMMDHSAGVEARGSTEALTKPLPPRTEFVVWLVPSKDQVRIYQKALETSEIIHEANSKRKLGVEVFRAIGLLKRLCNHPALALPTHENWQRALATAGEGLLGPAELTRMARPSKRTKGPAESDPHPVEPEEDDAAQDAQPGKAVERMLRNLKSSAEAMIAQSAKLKCLAALLPALESRGHRTLIFSQGIRMMDLVEICVLRKQKIKYLRIDGHTEIAARNERVRLFQTQTQSYTCMLLTTRVGGFGLNLTSADRVIILDPAWNPAVDMQAVDRAHRIGQDREVKTYRLVMSGLIEDKMFRLQVFKMGLTKTALETKQQQRYFTAEEIHGLFEWTDPAHGETRALLRHQHGIEDCAAQCDAPHEWLKAGPAVGLSSFSFLYSTLQGDQDDELAGAAPEVRLMKAKLKIAEDAAGKAAAARLVKEGSLTTAQQQLEKAAAEIKSASSAHSTASEQLKRAQAALGQSKRQEGLVEKEVEKAQQSFEASAKRLAEAEAKRDQHDAEVASGTDEARQGATALEEAETKLSKTLAQVEAELEKGLALEAPVAKIKAAQKAAARLAEADEAARSAREAAGEEWDKALAIESRCAEHQTDMTLAMQGLAPTGSPPLKTLQSARRTAEKEKQTAEKAVAKVSVSGSRAVERLNQAVAEIKSALNAVTSSLHGQSGEATQAYAKVLDGIGKELAEDWRSSRAAAEAAARGAANQRRAQRARLSSNSKAREEAARHAIVQRQYAKVTQNLEEALQTAQAAVAEAEGRERQQKRLRDDCKTAICDAKQCLKSARLAEKEATAERTSLYKHYAKADEGLKDALKFAKSAEQASAAERQKAIAAIKALRAEEYDANQVVEAYESKKRARQDQQDVA